MTLRPARKSDASEASVLMFDAIEDIAYALTGAEKEEEILPGLALWFVQEGNRLSYQHMLVKEVDQHVVGFILCYHGSEAETIDRPIQERLRQLKNDPSIVVEKEADEDEYYIDSLAVSPGHAGKGIATDLIKAAEEQASRHGYRKIGLIVTIDNKRALDLYKRLGYTLNGEKVIHHSPYYHMVKHLD
ncbi:GNAT family N-acetyltransferase [Paenibacillus sp. SYP-B3998]|uniref:GNAT family N-acetyltransferase n=1 Tax=Paenibacillus sp. SYP-B3998 TaxID=2678564 RepID=A0A6G4A0Q7_9BACL|nr:GNAT family N-acetyltransferase [Paenibacillus sp. SYP-B3998]NEW07930.1 GNAT family N-acetyltransferase [Paenibacillus sp. SYP-B3998]